MSGHLSRSQSPISSVVKCKSPILYQGISSKQFEQQQAKMFLYQNFATRIPFASINENKNNFYARGCGNVKVRDICSSNNTNQVIISQKQSQPPSVVCQRVEQGPIKYRSGSIINCSSDKIQQITSIPLQIVRSTSFDGGKKMIQPKQELEKKPTPNICFTKSDNKKPSMLLADPNTVMHLPNNHSSNSSKVSMGNLQVSAISTRTPTKSFHNLSEQAQKLLATYQQTKENIFVQESKVSQTGKQVTSQSRSTVYENPFTNTVTTITSRPVTSQDEKTMIEQIMLRKNSKENLTSEQTHHHSQSYTPQISQNLQTVVEASFEQSLQFSSLFANHSLEHASNSNSKPKIDIDDPNSKWAFLFRSNPRAEQDSNLAELACCPSEKEVVDYDSKKYSSNIAVASYQSEGERIKRKKIEMVLEQSSESSSQIMRENQNQTFTSSKTSNKIVDRKTQGLSEGEEEEIDSFNEDTIQSIKIKNLDSKKTDQISENQGSLQVNDSLMLSVSRKQSDILPILFHQYFSEKKMQPYNSEESIEVNKVSIRDISISSIENLIQLNIQEDSQQQSDKMTQQEEIQGFNKSNSAEVDEKLQENSKQERKTYKDAQTSPIRVVNASTPLVDSRTHIQTDSNTNKVDSSYNFVKDWEYEIASTNTKISNAPSTNNSRKVSLVEEQQRFEAQEQIKNPKSRQHSSSLRTRPSQQYENGQMINHQCNGSKRDMNISIESSCASLKLSKDFSTMSGASSIKEIADRKRDEILDKIKQLDDQLNFIHSQPSDSQNFIQMMKFPVKQSNTRTSTPQNTRGSTPKRMFTQRSQSITFKRSNSNSELNAQGSTRKFDKYIITSNEDNYSLQNSSTKSTSKITPISSSSIKTISGGINKEQNQATYGNQAPAGFTKSHQNLISRSSTQSKISNNRSAKPSSIIEHNSQLMNSHRPVPTQLLNSNFLLDQNIMSKIPQRNSNELNFQKKRNSLQPATNSYQKPFESGQHLTSSKENRKLETSKSSRQIKGKNTNSEPLTVVNLFEISKKRFTDNSIFPFEEMPKEIRTLPNYEGNTSAKRSTKIRSDTQYSRDYNRTEENQQNQHIQKAFKSENEERIMSRKSSLVSSRNQQFEPKSESNKHVENKMKQFKREFELEEVQTQNIRAHLEQLSQNAKKFNKMLASK